MTDFPICAEVGPPKGTLFNYPIKPQHHAQPSVVGWPAPQEIATQIASEAVMPKMIARVAQRGMSIDQSIALAEQELYALVDAVSFAPMVAFCDPRTHARSDRSRDLFGGKGRRESEEAAYRVRMTATCRWSIALRSACSSTRPTSKKGRDAGRRWRRRCSRMHGALAWRLTTKDPCRGRCQRQPRHAQAEQRTTTTNAKCGSTPAGTGATVPGK